MRKNILILARTLPLLGGQGMAMRLGSLVQAACEEHAVTLLVLSPDPGAAAHPVLAYWQGLCSRVLVCHVPPMAAAAPAGNGALLKRLLRPQPHMFGHWPIAAIAPQLTTLRGLSFDLVLVSRLAMAPVWKAIARRLDIRAGQQILDLDDIESISHARQTRIAGVKSLGKAYYAAAWVEWLKLRRAEAQAFRAMHRVLICSDQDKQVLHRRFGDGKVHVVPNTVRVAEQLPAKPAAGRLELLFVGTLDYPPNDDAVHWLLAEIMPAIRARLGDGAAVLRVIGRKAPGWMRERAQRGEMELHADVPDVAPYYEQADAVLVPIRSGSGTRIKILEAFALGRAVISTTTGMEGIAARDGEELLIADSAQAYADAVARLAGDPALRDALVRAGRTLVEERYSAASCVRALKEAMA
jgi:glycosyltransferase involved in cell wall biosynthesis